MDHHSAGRSSRFWQARRVPVMVTCCDSELWVAVTAGTSSSTCSVWVLRAQRCPTGRCSAVRRRVRALGSTCNGPRSHVIRQLQRRGVRVRHHTGLLGGHRCAAYALAIIPSAFSELSCLPTVSQSNTERTTRWRADCWMQTFISMMIKPAMGSQGHCQRRRRLVSHQALRMVPDRPRVIAHPAASDGAIRYSV